MSVIWDIMILEVFCGGFGGWRMCVLRRFFFLCGGKSAEDGVGFFGWRVVGVGLC